MMASGMNNYAGASMNEYAGTGMHSASMRPGPSRPGTRFAAAVRNPEPAEPWDQISDEHRSEINDCFHLFDMNKDDQLDFSEFRYALQALGFSNLSRPDLITAFKSAAHPKPNWTPLPSIPGQPPPATAPSVVDLRLSREGFQSIAARYIAARDPREELLKTFMLFDKGTKGMITVEDLRTVVKELNEDVPENEIHSMIEQFDVEGKGGRSVIGGQSQRDPDISGGEEAGRGQETNKGRGGDNGVTNAHLQRQVSDASPPQRMGYMEKRTPSQHAYTYQFASQGMPRRSLRSVRSRTLTLASTGPWPGKRREECERAEQIGEEMMTT
ncbi:hypothetical protein FHL15_003477 [Xylaria flabelliformis]|uniref:Calmodulin n=1 Tax=Xylaria flabelliformis TaxID=2512241 RepID=A0A553I5N4_9PEZI|nr:hypothetical protein FHL15_003477 [Xylaria flabelliformis]